jgi:hypothetical protein
MKAYKYKDPALLVCFLSTQLKNLTFFFFPPVLGLELRAYT